jgi:RimJ/RimL family protein N-acetyltransferase
MDDRVASPRTTLYDGSLRLRPAVLPDDVTLGAPWYSDPEVLHFSEGEGTPPYDAEMVERMYRQLAAHGELYIIEVQHGAEWRAIGDAALCPNSLPIVIGEAAFRSRGLGTRVLRLMIRRARALGWAKLGIQGIYTYNIRSRRLFERAGFKLAGEVVDQDGRLRWLFQELALR